MPSWVRVIGTIVGLLSLLSAALPSGGGASATSAGPLVLDPFVTPAYVVMEAHASGRAAFCHIRAGVWQPGRPDSARLARAATAVPAHPAELVHFGAPATVETGLRWLSPDWWALAATVLEDRLELCAAKGFDGAVLTDFGPSRHPSIGHTRALIDAAHGHNLIVVLIGHTDTAGLSAVRPPAGAAGTAGTRRTTGS